MFARTNKFICCLDVRRISIHKTTPVSFINQDNNLIWRLSCLRFACNPHDGSPTGAINWTRSSRLNTLKNAAFAPGAHLNTNQGALIEPRRAFAVALAVQQVAAGRRKSRPSGLSIHFHWRQSALFYPIILLGVGVGAAATAVRSYCLL